MLPVHWQPTANIKILKSRALIIQAIRTFLTHRGILEVQTPILGKHTTTDRHIDSLTTHCFVPGEPHLQKRFLQTSPEFAMKRLLAAGSGAIFQIAKAFRQDPHGKQHNPEFTLLEWYRPDFDHHQLMTEVDALLQQVLKTKRCEKITYQHLFEKTFNLCPFECTVHALKALAIKQKIHIDLPVTESMRNTWLDLLMGHTIEPTLGHEQPVFIYNYPLSQGGFAKANADNLTTARFEVYANGMELANGYHEITCADEQQARFEMDNQRRIADNVETIALDTALLAALKAGLPDCAGVALGIDRLVMIALQHNTIDDVIAFPIE